MSTETRMNLAFQTLWLRLAIQDWKSGKRSSKESQFFHSDTSQLKHSQINGNVLVAVGFYKEWTFNIV